MTDSDQMLAHAKHLVADLFRPDVLELDMLGDHELLWDGEPYRDSLDAVELARCVEEESGVAIRRGEEFRSGFTNIASVADSIYAHRDHPGRTGGPRTPAIALAAAGPIRMGEFARMARCAVSLILGFCATLGVRAAEDAVRADWPGDRLSYSIVQDAPIEWSTVEAGRRILTPESSVFTLPGCMSLRTVVEPATRRLTAESFFSRSAFDQELVRRELTDFDRFVLNRYPLVAHVGFVRFGLASSNGERARERYQAEEKLEWTAEMMHFAEALAAVDPAEAKTLRGFVGKSAGPDRTADDLKFR